MQQLDNNKQLASSSINEIAQALTILNSVRNNNSTPEQVLASSLLIQSEYGNLTLGVLQQIILDGIMQKFNRSNNPQYNDIPSLMFWLREYTLNNMKVIY